MAKTSRATPATPAAPETLLDSVDRLTAEVRLLRQILDELREDFSWVTRNGLPVQPVEHVVVQQMARDPCAKDWGKRLVIQRNVYPTDAIPEPTGTEVPKNGSTPGLDTASQEQLYSVVTALDRVREQLAKAVAVPQEFLNSGTATMVAVSQPVLAKQGRQETPPPGCLF